MSGKRVFALVLVLSLFLSGCSDVKTDVEPDTTSADLTAGTGFSLGNIMPELTVTTADGQILSTSQLLEKKELVVLNFWFANCPWCLKEFPVMEVAYQQYRENVEILAVNPVDSAEQIGAFYQENSYSFPMAGCSRDLALAFGINGYPTSVFIDREGKICLIHAGAITDTNTFYELFDHFTAEDYQSQTFLNIGELVK